MRQAEAALRYARSNVAQRPAYRENIAALRSAVTSAEAALHAVEAQRTYTVLTSPLTGYVTGRFMDPGAMATPGQPIVAVQEFRQVWVNVPIPEEVSRKVSVGMPAEARFDAFPGRVFAGRVNQVNPSADPQSRQFTVRVQIENPGNQIRPGMFARVNMVVERVRSTITVPLEAVQQGPQGPTVTVVTNVDQGQGTAQRRPVVTGASDSKGVAILQGVQPGEKVITLSAMPIKDSQAVRIGGAGRPGGRGGAHKPGGAGARG